MPEDEFYPFDLYFQYQIRYMYAGIEATMTREAHELRSILELEKKDALTLGDIIGGIAIAFLIAAIIDYLTKD